MAIQLPDGRLLSDEVLDALRLRALRGRELGFTEADLADLLGVTRETICRWWTAYLNGGIDALPHQRTGRPKGSGRALSDEQARHIQTLLDTHQPKDHDIAAPLWRRSAVAALIHQETGVSLAARTVGEYLRDWGYTLQRPTRTARQQDPDEVRRWLEETYPAVVQRAAVEGAVIYWCDELGIGIDEFRGRGYARPGHPPPHDVTGSHTRVNGISAISNRGEAHFMTFTGTLDAAVLIAFLALLLQETDTKVFVVLDNLQVHGSAEVATWVAAHADRIELVPMPKYSPERQPVEYLNNDAKGAVNAHGMPSNQAELHSNLIEFLHKLAYWPERVMSYFRHPAVQYAAANTM
jgi:transposase